MGPPSGGKGSSLDSLRVPKCQGSRAPPPSCCPAFHLVLPQGPCKLKSLGVKGVCPEGLTPGRDPPLGLRGISRWHPREMPSFSGRTTGATAGLSFVTSDPGLPGFQWPTSAHKEQENFPTPIAFCQAHRKMTASVSSRARKQSAHPVFISVLMGRCSPVHGPAELTLLHRGHRPALPGTQGGLPTPVQPTFSWATFSTLVGPKNP